MANTMEIVVKAQDQASAVIEGIGDTASGAAVTVEKSWGKAGAAAGKAGESVGGLAGAGDTAGAGGRAAAEGWDRAAESADNVDTRAMGFRDTLTGIQDGTEGIKRAASGDWGFETLLLLGFGIGDLASGMFNLLIPALKSTWAWLGQTKAATLAQAAAGKVVSGATKVWTAVQTAFNFVMALNPVLLIVLAVIALIAVIVIAYRQSETFRAIVDAAFRWVWNLIKKVWAWIRDNWKLLLAILTGPIGIAVLLITKNWDKIKRGASSAKNWIVNAFKGLGNVIAAPFRAGFNAIRAAWNATIGGKGFTVPSWVPGVGGKSFRIPRLHSGGVFRAPPGQGEGLALLRDMERVTTPEDEAETKQLLGAIVEHLRGGGGQAIVVENHIEIGGEVVRVVRTEIKADRRDLKRRVTAGAGRAA